jgi:hypothetical protein
MYYFIIVLTMNMNDDSFLSPSKNPRMARKSTSPVKFFLDRKALISSPSHNNNNNNSYLNTVENDILGSILNVEKLNKKVSQSINESESSQYSLFKNNSFISSIINDQTKRIDESKEEDNYIYLENIKFQSKIEFPTKLNNYNTKWLSNNDSNSETVYGKGIYITEHLINSIIHANIKKPVPVNQRLFEDFSSKF